MTFEELLRANAEREPERPRPLPDAQIAELRDMCQRYGEPCPFKVGDLITPRPGMYADSGEPMIVMEVFDPPIRALQTVDITHIFSNGFGARLDIRVAKWTPHGWFCHMNESWMHEPYTGGAGF